MVTYDSSDCFEFRGRVVDSIEGGYRVDTEGWGTSYPGDVFVRWEGNYRFVEGDLVVVTGAVVEPLTYETQSGTIRTIPALYGSSMLDIEQHNRQVAATREIIEVTRQSQYRADYEQRAVDALQVVRSCRRTGAPEIMDRLYDNYDKSQYIFLGGLDLNYSIGPAPDRIDPDTVPHILVDGYYRMQPVQSGSSLKRGQVVARWTGRDCEFTDFRFNEGVWPTPTPKPTNIPTPTKDPNAPKPTYTPRPIPTRR